jgi:hypothetical protein
MPSFPQLCISEGTTSVSVLPSQFTIDVKFLFVFPSSRTEREREKERERERERKREADLLSRCAAAHEHAKCVVRAVIAEAEMIRGDN